MSPADRCSAARGRATYRRVMSMDVAEIAAMIRRVSARMPPAFTRIARWTPSLEAASRTVPIFLPWWTISAVLTRNADDPVKEGKSRPRSCGRLLRATVWPSERISTNASESCSSNASAKLAIVAVSTFQRGTARLTCVSRAVSFSRSCSSRSIVRMSTAMATTAKPTSSRVTTPMKASVKRLLTLQVPDGRSPETLPRIVPLVPSARQLPDHSTTIARFRTDSGMVMPSRRAVAPLIFRSGSLSAWTGMSSSLCPP